MRRFNERSGMTIMELTVASSIIAIILLSSFALLERDVNLSQSTVGISVAEMKAQQMLRKIEGELADARGATLNAVVTAQCAATDTTHVQVDSTLGFPDQGILLVNRGTASEERIRYGSLEATGLHFRNLMRGQLCTGASTHEHGTEIMWLGLAEPLELQTNPPAGTWDGVALEPTGQVFFRGDGTGFSYRIPVDPTGGTDYLDGDEIRWGALVGDTQSTTGWNAIHFEPRFTFDESVTNDDINNDGDTVDVFDVGQLRRRTWDTSDPNLVAADLGLGPTTVLQERCNYGSDLDGDGFDDPIFLWDPDLRRLHVRLYILGSTRSDVPIVRRVESMIFLRNTGLE